jgi:hypothetical protein
MDTSKNWVLALLMLTVFACKNPTDDIKIVVDTNIIKYTAMVNVTDGQTGNQVGNATIAISGAAAPQIYELSGKKNFQLTAGMVTIGLHPNLVPSPPVSITVEITAPGYNKDTREVVFTMSQAQQVVNIMLTKTGTVTPPVVTPPPPTYNSVALNFTGRCPNRPDVEIRPSVYVYFRKSGSTVAFQYLGYMDKGNIETKLLAQNETYEFQIVFGGETYRIIQKVEQTSYRLTVDMPAACNF